MEAAAGWRIRRAGQVALQQDALSRDPRIGHGHGGQQAFGVGVAGGVEQGVAVSYFDDVAEIHDSHAVTDVAHHRQIVCDEQVGQAELRLQIGQQVHHLRLYRHVERRYRFITDDQLGLQRQRPRNAQALALPAGELMRVFFRGFGPQADLGKQPLHALLPLCCIRCAKVAQRLGHDLARCQART